MNRSMRVFVALSACAFLLAACGSSSSGGTKTTLTIGNSVPRTAPATSPPVPIGVDACSLVTSAEVTSLLGSAATGKEQDATQTHKTCEWDTAGLGPSKMYLGLLRVGNGEAGFATNVVGLSPQVLSGVGDSATYSAGTGSAGSEQRFLVSSKGTVSLSLTILYGRTTQPPASVQDQMTSIAKTVFTTLHA